MSDSLLTIEVGLHGEDSASATITGSREVADALLAVARSLNQDQVTYAPAMSVRVYGGEVVEEVIP